MGVDTQSFSPSSSNGTCADLHGHEAFIDRLRTMVQSEAPQHGHVFQDRFKSILCQEETYFLELIRYIHLNPIRARLVKDLDGLGRYAYCGHSVLIGRAKPLAEYGRGTGDVRGKLRRCKAGVQDRRVDLTGGGLLRSAGGWEGVTLLREEKAYQKNDERILGVGDFVGRVLASAEETMEKRYAL